MLAWLKEMWVGSESVEFESAFDLDQSVERLKAATRRRTLLGPSGEAAVGTVTKSKVSLQRVIPMLHNSFKPFFVGRFEQSGGKVQLTGRFTLHWFVKAFMGVWFGGVALFTVATVPGVAQSPGNAVAPLAGILMASFGLGLLRVGQWLSRNDRAWLSNVIRTALNAPAAGAGPAVAGPSAARLTSTALAGVAAALAVLGPLACASALTGIQAFRSHEGMADVTRYADEGLHLAIGVYGLVLLTMAYGVYRRHLLAWRAGFVVLVAAWAISMFGTSAMEDARMPAPVVAFFGVASAVVMLVWGRWWYTQRVHFDEDARRQGTRHE